MNWSNQFLHFSNQLKINRIFQSIVENRYISYNLAEGYEVVTGKILEAVTNNQESVIPELLEDLKRIIPEENIPEEDHGLILRARELSEIGFTDNKRLH